MIENTFHFRHTCKTLLGFWTKYYSSSLKLYDEDIKSLIFNKLFFSEDSVLKEHGRWSEDGNKLLMRLIDTKLILLSTLANARLPQSRSLLTHYAQPNYGHEGWRHSALEALGYYKCQEVWTKPNLYSIKKLTLWL